MIFADKLVKLRKKSGMSQEELAEKMNVSRQAVSKWESAQSVPDLEKILQLGNLFGVTLDYLLKDELEEEEFTGRDYEDKTKKVTLAQANEFLGLRKKAAKSIALATFICILAATQFIVWGGASELKELPLSEDAAVSIGMIILLVMVAAAVGIYVYTGFKSEAYRFLETEPFEVEYGVESLVRERQKAFRDTYVKGNIAGVVLCILSAAALFAGVSIEEDFILVLLLAVMMLLCGFGVLLFINVGVQWASMQKLLKEGDYTDERKSEARKTKPFVTVYWLIVTAIFLAWTFIEEKGGEVSGRESLSWIVFPIAGVLFAAVLGIFKMINRRNDK